MTLIKVMLDMKSCCIISKKYNYHQQSTIIQKKPSGPTDWALCLLHTIDCLSERNNYEGKAAEQSDTQLILQMKLAAIETCSSNHMQLLCLEVMYNELSVN